jgi:hypothetical protein
MTHKHLAALDLSSDLVFCGVDKAERLEQRVDPPALPPRQVAGQDVLSESHGPRSNRHDAVAQLEPEKESSFGSRGHVGFLCTRLSRIEDEQTEDSRVRPAGGTGALEGAFRLSRMLRRRARSFLSVRRQIRFSPPANDAMRMRAARSPAAPRAASEGTRDRGPRTTETALSVWPRWGESSTIYPSCGR